MTCIICQVFSQLEQQCFLVLLRANAPPVSAAHVPPTRLGLASLVALLLAKKGLRGRKRERCKQITDRCRRVQAAETRL